MTNDTKAHQAPSIRITLSFFEDFPTVAGLLRDTGARREGARLFVIDGDMTIAQVAALMKLVQHSRNREVSDPVKIEVVSSPNRYEYSGMQEELYDWWGTVDDWR